MSPSDSRDARRSAPRAGAILRLRYRNAGHLLVSYCTNLSRGGLFVPTDAPLAAGTAITVILEIPGHDDPVALHAEVRWARGQDGSEGPAGMGLAFGEVDDALGERIDAIVTDHQPMQIALCGDRAHRVAGQIQLLVTCQTHNYRLRRAVSSLVGDMDLVVVDASIHPDETLALLEAVARPPAPPPCVVLCEPTAPGRDRLAALSRLVDAPVDPQALRVAVLQTITDVRAERE